MFTTRKYQSMSSRCASRMTSRPGSPGLQTLLPTATSASSRSSGLMLGSVNGRRASFGQVIGSVASSRHGLDTSGWLGSPGSRTDGGWAILKESPLMLPSLSNSGSRPQSGVHSPLGSAVNTHRSSTVDLQSHSLAHPHHPHIHHPRTGGTSSLGGCVSLYTPQHDVIFGPGGLEMHMVHPLSDEEIIRLHNKHIFLKKLSSWKPIVLKAQNNVMKHAHKMAQSAKNPLAESIAAEENSRANNGLVQVNSPRCTSPNRIVCHFFRFLLPKNWWDQIFSASFVTAGTKANSDRRTVSKLPGPSAVNRAPLQAAHLHLVQWALGRVD
jgi:hypothetical protein